jgi:hypothetical protein
MNFLEHGFLFQEKFTRITLFLDNIWSSEIDIYYEFGETSHFPRQGTNLRPLRWGQNSSTLTLNTAGSSTNTNLSDVIPETNVVS